MPSIEPIDLYVEAHPLPSSVCDVYEQTFPASSGPSRTPVKSRRASPYPNPFDNASRGYRARSRSSSPTSDCSSDDDDVIEQIDQDSLSDEESDDSATKTSQASTPRSSRSRLVSSLTISSSVSSAHLSCSRDGKSSVSIAPAGSVGETTTPTKATRKEVRFSEHKPQQSRGAPVIDDDDDDLISKPAGEVGHPGRGGYKLADVLKWSNTQYQAVMVRLSSHFPYGFLFAVQKFVNRVVDDHLDCEKPLRNQSLSQVKKVRDAVRCSL